MGGRSDTREPLVLLAICAAALVVSGIEPYDRATWILEVGPVLVGIPILAATVRRFPLTPFATPARQVAVRPGRERVPRLQRVL